GHGPSGAGTAPRAAGRATPGPEPGGRVCGAETALGPAIRERPRGLHPPQVRLHQPRADSLWRPSAVMTCSANRAIPGLRATPFGPKRSTGQTRTAIQNSPDILNSPGPTETHRRHDALP